MGKEHIGSSFDDFLEEDGILAETQAAAIKRVVAWQIQQYMEENSVSKVAMAKRMNTSRSAIDRLLDPANTSLTVQTMGQVSQVIGKKLKVSFA